MSTSGASNSSGPRPAAVAKSSGSEPASDRSSADVGIVCSHKGELKSFLKRLDRQRKYAERRMVVRGGFLGETLRVAIVEAGPEFADHRAAAELLIAEHRPTWILSCGFSSALHSDIKAGDLCLASEVTDTHGNLLPVKCTIAARKRIHVGRLVVADDRPEDADARAALALAHPGLAVDTSSLAVAQVCHDRSVRCLIVRAIIDELTETIPAQAASMLFNPDSRAIGTAFGSLMKSVRNWSELNTWRTRGTTAAENLDRFITGIIEQIGQKLGR